VEKLFKSIDFTAKLFFYTGVLSGILMTLIILISTLLRYLAGQPIPFSDELAGLLFLTMAFTTIPHVLSKSAHISLDLLTERMSFGLKKICSLFAAAIFIAFAITFSYQAWNFMEFSRLISSRTDVSGILLWPWMALMPASMILCIAVEIKKQFRPNDGDTSGKTTS
jgi:TRAP-type C4-dicarboxylate transport system permease small subunit